MVAQIKQHLLELEEKEGIKILMAVDNKQKIESLLIELRRELYQKPIFL